MVSDKDGRRKDNLSKELRSAIGRKGGQAPHPAGRGLQNADKATRKKVSAAGGAASSGGGRTSEDEEDQK